MVGSGTGRLKPGTHAQSRCKEISDPSFSVRRARGSTPIWRPRRRGPKPIGAIKGDGRSSSARRFGKPRHLRQRQHVRSERCRSWPRWSRSCCCSCARMSRICCSRAQRRARKKFPSGCRSARRARGSSGSCSPKACCWQPWAGMPGCSWRGGDRRFCRRRWGRQRPPTGDVCCSRRRMTASLESCSALRRRFAQRRWMSGRAQGKQPQRGRLEHGAVASAAGHAGVDLACCCSSAPDCFSER